MSSTGASSTGAAGPIGPVGPTPVGPTPTGPFSVGTALPGATFATAEIQTYPKDPKDSLVETVELKDLSLRISAVATRRFYGWHPSVLWDILSHGRVIGSEFRAEGESLLSPHAGDALSGRVLSSFITAFRSVSQTESDFSEDESERVVVAAFRAWKQSLIRAAVMQMSGFSRVMSMEDMKSAVDEAFILEVMGS